MVVGRDSFTVTYTRQAGRRPKGPRVYYRVRADNGPRWDIPNNDIESVKHAIIERVFFVKIAGAHVRAPKPHAHPDFRGRTHARLLASLRVRGMLSQFENSVVSHAIRRPPLSSREFIDRYSGAKKKVYEAAARSISKKAFDPRRDSKVKIFTKDEYRKPGGAPRAIQPRSPRFNIMLGRHISHVEHDVYRAIDLTFDPSGARRTVQKGLNYVERGHEIHKAWREIHDPVCITLDATRFDQHLNVDLLRCANRVTREFCVGFSDDLPNLATLLDLQLHNKGVFFNWEGKISYQTEGCGMSGDMNTSLRNVIVMCGAMFAFMKKFSIDGRYGNDGDDGWLIVSSNEIAKIKQELHSYFEKFGLTMKIEKISSYMEDIEFCQGKPVYNEDHGYVLIPSPNKRLYSDLVSTKNLSSSKVFHKWVGAVAGCGLSQTRGVPVLSAHYKWLATGATPWIPQEGDEFFRQSWWSGVRSFEKIRLRDRKITNRERISFYLAYNITPRSQIQIERHLLNLPRIAWNKPIPVVNTLDVISKALVPPVQQEE